MGNNIERFRDGKPSGETGATRFLESLEVQGYTTR